jgi:hypothetical protein
MVFVEFEVCSSLESGQSRLTILPGTASPGFLEISRSAIYTPVKRLRKRLTGVPGGIDADHP